MSIKHSSWQAGLSLIELILAIAIMSIIAATAVAGIVGAWGAQRLAREQSQATSLATQGLAASEALRNQGWDSLTLGSHGLSWSGSGWSLTGSNDTDPSGTFTRQLTVSSVQRDGSNQIVTSGGTVDPNTKHILVSVQWNFSPTRQNTVELKQYLTRWDTAYGGGTASPPPGITTCAQYCQSLNYTTGTCRANTNQCTNNGETYVSAGDTYCTGGNNADTCCCQ